MATVLFFTEMKKIDSGTTYLVTDVQQKDVAYGKPVDDVFYLGDDIAIELKKNLVAGNRATIPVATVDEKGAGFVELSDFTIEETTDLDQYKNKKLQKIKNIFSYNLSAVSGVIIFKALNSFAILASNGYFITNDNREEKYLEIINGGDAALISALEDYLAAYDAISPVANMYTEMKQAEVAISASSTEAEVDTAASSFDTAS